MSRTPFCPVAPTLNGSPAHPDAAAGAPNAPPAQPAHTGNPGHRSRHHHHRLPRSPLGRLHRVIAVCALGLLGAWAPAGPAEAAPTQVAAKDRPAARQGDRVKRQRWPTERPARTLPPAPKLGSVPFIEGERLQFDIKMLGARAGECLLAVGQRRREGAKGVVEFAAFLRSSEFLSKFYPIEDTLRVVVDEKTFLPITSTFNISENKAQIDYLTDFQQPEKLVLSDRYKDGKRVSRNYTPEGPIFEALSSIYAARRLDLKPGLKFQYYVWDGRRERLVDVVAVKDERIWTPLGWFDTVKVELSSVITGGFIKNGELKAPRKRGYAWFAKDAHRTPVKLSTPTKLGDAEAVLVRRWIEPAGALAAPTTPVDGGPLAPTSAPGSEPAAPPAPETAPAAP